MALQQPLFPAMRDYFNIGTHQYMKASAIPMAFSLSSATGQLPAGWAADKFGPVSLIMIGTLGVAVAGVLVGLSNSFIMLLLTLVLEQRELINEQQRQTGLLRVMATVAWVWLALTILGIIAGFLLWLLP